MTKIVVYMLLIELLYKLKMCFMLQSFKSIAKVLGTAISDREDLRMEVMASLRKLINQSKDNGECERCHKKTCFRRFATGFDSNQPT